MSYPDAGVSLFYPQHYKTVDVSAADFDCTAFPIGFATGIYVGATGDVAVLAMGDTVAVTFKAVPTGTFIPGCFKTILHTGSTATLMLAAGM
jgi:hypothetical protein